MLSHPCPPALQFVLWLLTEELTTERMSLPPPDAADMLLPQRGWARVDGTSHQSTSDAHFFSCQERLQKMAWESSQQNALGQCGEPEVDAGATADFRLENTRGLWWNPCSWHLHGLLQTSPQMDISQPLEATCPSVLPNCSNKGQPEEKQKFRLLQSLG